MNVHMKRRNLNSKHTYACIPVLLLGILGIQAACIVYVRQGLKEDGKMEAGFLGTLWTDRVEEKQYKNYLFYDAGQVYHDMNFTCPVQWVC